MRLRYQILIYMLFASAFMVQLSQPINEAIIQLFASSFGDEVRKKGYASFSYIGEAHHIYYSTIAMLIMLLATPLLALLTVRIVFQKHKVYLLPIHIGMTILFSGLFAVSYYGYLDLTIADEADPFHTLMHPPKIALASAVMLSTVISGYFFARRKIVHLPSV
jgi:hypothetical protein